MVNVSIERGTDRAHVLMEGHADFNPGNDIVCSAISALGYSLLGLLKNYAEETPGCINLEFTEENGLIDCKVTQIHFSHINRLNTALDMLFIGLKQIELQYPDSIKVVFTKM
jgi:uncharacterized protein YsxB (DUF464 family)